MNIEAAYSVMQSTCMWHTYVAHNTVYLVLHKNQSTGYASQHIWCLSQARINWQGCGRKGIWRMWHKHVTMVCRSQSGTSLRRVNWNENIT